MLAQCPRVHVVSWILANITTSIFGGVHKMLRMHSVWYFTYSDRGGKWLLSVHRKTLATWGKRNWPSFEALLVGFGPQIYRFTLIPIEQLCPTCLTARFT